MDDLEAVLDDADGHELLAVVVAVHHQRVHKALNNGALANLKLFLRTYLKPLTNSKLFSRTYF